MTKHTIEELQDQIEKLKQENIRLKHGVKQQRFGLVWMDMPEAYDAEIENKLPILKEVKDKAIINNDGKPTHIIIEGDNYHALTCLNYTHKEKIDVIYIDPPYNTGSDGFRYKDKRVIKEFPDGTPVPKDSPFRHSYWLSFMSKRLELAKNLLKDTGMIFISINEDELAHLKILCDKLFNPENYLTLFTIKVRHEERILKGDKDYHEVVEYLLLYRKSPKLKTPKKQKDNTSISDYIYKIVENQIEPEYRTMGNKTVSVFKPGEFEIKKITADKSNLKKINIRGSIKEGNSSGRFFMKHLNNLMNSEKGYLYKVPDMGDDEIAWRYFLIPSGKRANGDYFQGVPISRKDVKDVPYPNYFDFIEEFNNVGYEGGVEFRNGKKPIEFIKKIFELAGVSKNAIILDFFAGSGSTLHALLDCTEIENSQCFLITNNENNICHSITFPRIKNAIQGTADISPLGNSLRYYKTEFIGKNNILNISDEDKIALAHNAGYLLAIAENTLDEIEKTNFFQFFENEKQTTAIYYREDLQSFSKFLKKVEALTTSVIVYIFSWSDASEFNSSFEHLPNVRLKNIPAPILEIYKQIYNIQ